MSGRDNRSESATKRGYGSRWQKARAAYLRQHPLCAMCGKPASVVDHIKPHKGDSTIFWDRDNWQPLCATHHNSTKQRQDLSGVLIGCDENGIPLDPDHQWNGGRGG